MPCDNPNCVNGKNFSKGTFNTDDGWSGVTNCTSCTGTKPEQDETITCNEIKSEGWCDEMCGLCDAIDKSDTKPEPKQDERFDGTKYAEWNTSVLIEEIRHMYNRIAGFKKKIKELGNSIEYRQRRIKELIKERRALKAEIKSMRCCGNCIYRFTCSSKENDTLGDGSCDNWTPKSKLWKDSTPTEIENDFRKIGGLPPLPEPPCTP